MPPFNMEPSEPHDAAKNALELEQRLVQIRTSPRLESQQQTAITLQAIEETAREKNVDLTPTAYFASLLSVLGTYTTPTAGVAVERRAPAVVYLLDIVTSYVPAAFLRSKSGHVLSILNPAVSSADADAPFIRSTIGCIVSLLLAQNSQSWTLPQTDNSPRQTLTVLLTLALDRRPKVRKRAQSGIQTVLSNRPPGPSLDHPAADMCAEFALRSFESLSAPVRGQNGHGAAAGDHDPSIIHALQLIKTIAKACRGWPSRSLDSLSSLLFSIAKTRSEYLTTATFEVFESIFASIVTDMTSEKLPRLLETVMNLQPSINDTQLLPPWLAVISRGHDVSAQIEPGETFQKLPEICTIVASFLASPAYNVRVSASECLVSFFVNCIPVEAILDPSPMDEKVFEKLGAMMMDLFSVKYQSAWMEIFKVLGALIESLRWHSARVLKGPVAEVGSMRVSDSLQNKEPADEVISRAIRYMGPGELLEILPLNIAPTPPGQQGRAWLLPLVRDSTSNTQLAHFRQIMVPMSERLYEKIMSHGKKEKTMEIKIFETLVDQIWSCLPGYCDKPLDLSEAFDQQFAEMVSNLLYRQTNLRADLCRALQNLVDSTQAIAQADSDDLIQEYRISREAAQRHLDHLSTFASNLLAVLFNVYEKTLPEHRGPLLACINSYLSIMKAAEISATFEKVITMLQSTIAEVAQPSKHNKKLRFEDVAPPLTHSLMDIVVTMSMYLPKQDLETLFNVAASLVTSQKDPQLQKKAYKLIPRIAQSPDGMPALIERIGPLEQMLLDVAEQTVTPAHRDRLTTLTEVVRILPNEDLHFIPRIAPEVMLRTKETNERAREAAFELIVAMGERMSAGGTIDNIRAGNVETAEPKTAASLEEYFTILSAGLAGSTPHMISASVTALSRALFHFRTRLSETSINELIDTMDLFLKSPTREVVSAVLGFVKVCVVALPISFLGSRLSSLIPNLLLWSHEHKGHFRSKVKNILERMTKKYGVEVVKRWTPEEDRKLITNIRKTRERQKKKKKADGDMADDDDDDDDEADHDNKTASKQTQFGNEFDEAIYGSGDSDSEGSLTNEAVNGQARKKQGRRKGRDLNETFIHESIDEPLDLLSRKAMSNISTTRPPLRGQASAQLKKPKQNADGKLVFRDRDDDHNSDEDMMDLDGKAGNDTKTLEQGINAYVEAIRGNDAARRGQRGRLKFSNKRARAGQEDEMEDDGEESQVKPARSRFVGRRRGGRGGRGGAGRGRGGFEAVKAQRKGLGADRTRGGRVQK